MKEDVRRGVIASIDAIPKHGGNRKQVRDSNLKAQDNIKYWTARAKRPHFQTYRFFVFNLWTT